MKGIWRCLRRTTVDRHATLTTTNNDGKETYVDNKQRLQWKQRLSTAFCRDHIDERWLHRWSTLVRSCQRLQLTQEECMKDSKWKSQLTRWRIQVETMFENDDNGKMFGMINTTTTTAACDTLRTRCKVNHSHNLFLQSFHWQQQRRRQIVRADCCEQKSTHAYQFQAWRELIRLESQS